MKANSFSARLFMTLLLEILCPVLANPSNGRVLVMDRNIGTIVTYKCDHGYFPLTPQGSECLENGAWTVTNLKCKGIVCVFNCNYSSSYFHEVIAYGEKKKFYYI